MARVTVFSKGKRKDQSLNEDAFLFDKKNFVVADGATDKSGKLYHGKTGGKILGEKVTQWCMESKKNGVLLVKELTEKTQKLYKELDSPALHDDAYKFAAAFVCVRMVGKKVHITQVADVCFRVNGKDRYINMMRHDDFVTYLRQMYINKTRDVKGARDFIFPLLKHQYRFSNDARHSLGYGDINGNSVPRKFIKTYSFSVDEVKKIEIFSDGYFSIPKGTQLHHWEQEWLKVEQEDPDKWKKYPSTKSKDDRTIMIVEF